MPVTINGSVLTQTDVTSPSPSTLTFTSTVLTAGDIVVVTVAENSPSTFGTASAPTGGTGLSWLQIILQQNTASHFSEAWAYWTKVPSDQTSTITITTTNTSDVGTAAALYRLSGVDQVNPIGLTDGFQGQTDPTGTDLQLSGTKAGSLIIAAASDWSAGTASLTISISNTTSAATDLNNLESGQFRALSNHGSQSGSTNQGTYDYSAATGDWAAIIFEIQAAADVAAAYTPPDTFLPGSSLLDPSDDTGDPALGFLYRAPDYASVPVSADVSVNAEDAEFTVLAQDAVAAVGVNADPVALTIAGQDAVAGVGANGDVAAISLVANNATPAVAVNAECATWTLAGNDATAAIGANAENALWTLAGQDAVAGLGANAGAVALTLATQDATAAIGANAEFAPINLVANDATVQVSGSINAPAECATWTLTSQDASASVGVNADVALITWSALDATAGVGAAADLALIVLSALDAPQSGSATANALSFPTVTAGRTSASTTTGNTSEPTMTAGRTSTPTATSSATSTQSASTRATSTPSVSDG